MLRLPVVLLASLVAALLASDSGDAAMFQAGTTANKFSVTFSIFPDPFHWWSFFPMPRTAAEARGNKFAQAAAHAEDQTTVWCRAGDYRVCVLFDARGSVAGVQMSVAVKDLQGVPTQFDAIPEWRRQTLLGEDVYTATAFFVSKDVLLGGGRDMTDDTPTAPDGIYILQKDGSRLAAPADQSAAAAAGFHEQNCFGGMGKHFFQISGATKCEAARPAFLLYGPQSSKLLGFGFAVFGRPSAGRSWFEAPSASAAKSIVPDSPACMPQWIDAHSLTTLHVYFVDNAYHIKC